MLVRRLAGMIMALLMLHLTLASSDAACATHMSDAHGAESAASMPMHGDRMSAAAAEHGPAVQESQAPCETPVQPNCCRALASCGAVFATRTAHSSTTLPDRAAIAASDLLIPLSELVAPDPPPPKV